MATVLAPHPSTAPIWRMGVRHHRMRPRVFSRVSLLVPDIDTIHAGIRPVGRDKECGGRSVLLHGGGSFERPDHVGAGPIFLAATSSDTLGLQTIDIYSVVYSVSRVSRVASLVLQRMSEDRERYPQTNRKRICPWAEYQARRADR